MKQFEYDIQVRIATQPYLSLEQLNELGKEGWELCTARLSGDGSDYIFKREVVTLDLSTRDGQDIRQKTGIKYTNNGQPLEMD